MEHPEVITISSDSEAPIDDAKKSTGQLNPRDPDSPNTTSSGDTFQVCPKCGMVCSEYAVMRLHLETNCQVGPVSIDCLATSSQQQPQRDVDEEEPDLSEFMQMEIEPVVKRTRAATRLKQKASAEQEVIVRQEVGPEEDMEVSSVGSDSNPMLEISFHEGEIEVIEVVEKKGKSRGREALGAGQDKQKEVGIKASNEGAAEAKQSRGSCSRESRGRSSEKPESSKKTGNSDIGKQDSEHVATEIGKKKVAGKDKVVEKRESKKPASKDSKQEMVESKQSSTADSKGRVLTRNNGESSEKCDKQDTLERQDSKQEGKSSKDSRQEIKASRGGTVKDKKEKSHEKDGGKAMSKSCELKQDRGASISKRDDINEEEVAKKSSSCQREESKSHTKAGNSPTTKSPKEKPAKEQGKSGKMNEKQEKKSHKDMSSVKKGSGIDTVGNKMEVEVNFPDKDTVVGVSKKQQMVQKDPCDTRSDLNQDVAKSKLSTATSTSNKVKDSNSSQVSESKMASRQPPSKVEQNVQKSKSMTSSDRQGKKPVVSFSEYVKKSTCASRKIQRSKPHVINMKTKSCDDAAELKKEGTSTEESDQTKVIVEGKTNSAEDKDTDQKIMHPERMNVKHPSKDSLQTTAAAKEQLKQIQHPKVGENSQSTRVTEFKPSPSCTKEVKSKCCSERDKKGLEVPCNYQIDGGSHKPEDAAVFAMATESEAQRKDSLETVSVEMSLGQLLGSSIAQMNVSNKETNKEVQQQISELSDQTELVSMDDAVPCAVNSEKTELLLSDKGTGFNREVSAVKVMEKNQISVTKQDESAIVESAKETRLAGASETGKPEHKVLTLEMDKEAKNSTQGGVDIGKDEGVFVRPRDPPRLKDVTMATRKPQQQQQEMRMRLIKTGVNSQGLIKRDLVDIGHEEKSSEWMETVMKYRCNVTNALFTSCVECSNFQAEMCGESAGITVIKRYRCVGCRHEFSQTEACQDHVTNCRQCVAVVSEETVKESDHVTDDGEPDDGQHDITGGVKVDSRAKNRENVGSEEKCEVQQPAQEKAAVVTSLNDGQSQKSSKQIANERFFDNGERVNEGSHSKDSSVKGKIISGDHTNNIMPSVSAEDDRSVSGERIDVEETKATAHGVSQKDETGKTRGQAVQSCVRDTQQSSGSSMDKASTKSHQDVEVITCTTELDTDASQGERNKPLVEEAYVNAGIGSMDSTCLSVVTGNHTSLKAVGAKEVIRLTSVAESSRLEENPVLGTSENSLKSADDNLNTGLNSLSDKLSLPMITPVSGATENTEKTNLKSAEVTSNVKGSKGSTSDVSVVKEGSGEDVIQNQLLILRGDKMTAAQSQSDEQRSGDQNVDDGAAIKIIHAEKMDSSQLDSVEESSTKCTVVKPNVQKGLMENLSTDKGTKAIEKLVVDDIENLGQNLVECNNTSHSMRNVSGSPIGTDIGDKQEVPCRVETPDDTLVDCSENVTKTDCKTTEDTSHYTVNIGSCKAAEEKIVTIKDCKTSSNEKKLLITPESKVENVTVQLDLCQSSRDECEKSSTGTNQYSNDGDATRETSNTVKTLDDTGTVYSDKGTDHPGVKVSRGKSVMVTDGDLEASSPVVHSTKCSERKGRESTSPCKNVKSSKKASSNSDGSWKGANRQGQNQETGLVTITADPTKQVEENREVVTSDQSEDVSSHKIVFIDITDSPVKEREGALLSPLVIEIPDDNIRLSSSSDAQHMDMQEVIKLTGKAAAFLDFVSEEKIRCRRCGACFCDPVWARVHVQDACQRHSTPEVPVTQKKELKNCLYCEMEYASYNSNRKHILKKHGEDALCAFLIHCPPPKRSDSCDTDPQLSGGSRNSPNVIKEGKAVKLKKSQKVRESRGNDTSQASPAVKATQVVKQSVDKSPDIIVIEEIKPHAEKGNKVKRKNLLASKFKKLPAARKKSVNIKVSKVIKQAKKSPKKSLKISPNKSKGAWKNKTDKQGMRNISEKVKSQQQVNMLTRKRIASAKGSRKVIDEEHVKTPDAKVREEKSSKKMSKRVADMVESNAKLQQSDHLEQKDTFVNESNTSEVSRRETKTIEQEKSSEVDKIAIPTEELAKPADPPSTEEAKTLMSGDENQEGVGRHLVQRAVTRWKALHEDRKRKRSDEQVNDTVVYREDCPESVQIERSGDTYTTRKAYPIRSRRASDGSSVSARSESPAEPAIKKPRQSTGTEEHVCRRQREADITQEDKELQSPEGRQSHRKESGTRKSRRFHTIEEQVDGKESQADFAKAHNELGQQSTRQLRNSSTLISPRNRSPGLASGKEKTPKTALKSPNNCSSERKSRDKTPSRSGNEDSIAERKTRSQTRLDEVNSKRHLRPRSVARSPDDQKSKGVMKVNQLQSPSTTRRDSNGNLRKESLASETETTLALVQEKKVEVNSTENIHGLIEDSGENATIVGDESGLKCTKAESVKDNAEVTPKLSDFGKVKGKSDEVIEKPFGEESRTVDTQTPKSDFKNETSMKIMQADESYGKDSKLSGSDPSSASGTAVCKTVQVEAKVEAKELTVTIPEQGKVFKASNLSPSGKLRQKSAFSPPLLQKRSPTRKPIRYCTDRDSRTNPKVVPSFAKTRKLASAINMAETRQDDGKEADLKRSTEAPKEQKKRDSSVVTKATVETSHVSREVETETFADVTEDNKTDKSIGVKGVHQGRKGRSVAVSNVSSEAKAKEVDVAGGAVDIEKVTMKEIEEEKGFSKSNSKVKNMLDTKNDTETTEKVDHTMERQLVSNKKEADQNFPISNLTAEMQEKKRNGNGEVKVDSSTATLSKELKSNNVPVTKEMADKASEVDKISPSSKVLMKTDQTKSKKKSSDGKVTTGKRQEGMDKNIPVASDLSPKKSKKSPGGKASPGKRKDVNKSEAQGSTQKVSQQNSQVTTESSPKKTKRSPDAKPRNEVHKEISDVGHQVSKCPAELGPKSNNPYRRWVQMREEVKKCSSVNVEQLIVIKKDPGSSDKVQVESVTRAEDLDMKLQKLARNASPVKVLGYRSDSQQPRSSDCLCEGQMLLEQQVEIPQAKHIEGLNTDTRATSPVKWTGLKNDGQFGNFGTKASGFEKGVQALSAVETMQRSVEAVTALHKPVLVQTRASGVEIEITVTNSQPVNNKLAVKSLDKEVIKASRDDVKDGKFEQSDQEEKIGLKDGVEMSGRKDYRKEVQELGKTAEDAHKKADAADIKVSSRNSSSDVEVTLQSLTQDTDSRSKRDSENQHTVLDGSGNEFGDRTGFKPMSSTSVSFVPKPMPESHGGLQQSAEVSCTESVLKHAVHVLTAQGFNKDLTENQQETQRFSPISPPTAIPGNQGMHKTEGEGIVGNQEVPDIVNQGVIQARRNSAPASAEISKQGVCVCMFFVFMGGHYFYFFRRPASAIRRHASFPLILMKSIRAIFTKFGVQDYWVSVLLGIVISCGSSFAY